MRSSAADRSKPPRLVSLDLLRGLAVIGMIIVNEMAGQQANGPVYPLLLHSHWDGLTIADVVFPAFLFMVGVSIPLSLRRKEEADYSRILWRTLRLLLLGFILSNQFWFSQFGSGTWRLFGVLQRIGLVYGACAVMFLTLSPRTRIVVAAAILILYWPLTLIPTLDGVPTDLWLRGRNFVGSADRVLLGPHLYVPGPEGYDPEGLLGTLPAIAQALIGVAIGEYLLRTQVRARLRKLAIAGAAMLVIGIAWGFVFPVVKDIWSSTFVLVTSGISLLVLAGLGYLFDGQPMTGLRRVVEIIVLPFGTNAIAAYTLHEVTWALLGWDLVQLPYRQLAPIMGPELAAFAPVLLYLAFIWLAMFYLWQRRWLIRI